MIAEISGDLVRVVILDVSGVYVQIYDQGYFNREYIGRVEKQYANTEHWRVLVLD